MPAVAPETEFLSPRPLFGRIASTRWYTQFYWPFALDQTPAGQAAGHYDRLLVDRNHDGDMADEGECVEGELDREQQTLRFAVGDLYLQGKGQDRSFQIREMAVRIEANRDPAVTFAAKMDQRMFEEVSYSLMGPYGSTMRFSAEVTRMPTLNLTPEIAAGPEFQGNRIQLFLDDPEAPFRIGKERPLKLVCLTGDRQQNDHVLAIENQSFARPVIATLIYTDQQGATRGREFKLEDWSDEMAFAGRITVPAEARPGEATLVVNFSEKAKTGGMYKHFTQLVFGGASYTDSNGREQKASGWQHRIELSR